MDFSPSTGGTVLRTETLVPKPLSEVFAFFADCHNLQVLTPASLNFRVLTPAAENMRKGLLIDYRLQLRGFPFFWQSEITAWEPPFRFVDEQRRGPYRRWIHEHRFEERDGGTLVTDSVDYASPGGRVIERLLVRPELRKIFNFREEQLLKHFS